MVTAVDSHGVLPPKRKSSTDALAALFRRLCAGSDTPHTNSSRGRRYSSGGSCSTSVHISSSWSNTATSSSSVSSSSASGSSSTRGNGSSGSASSGSSWNDGSSHGSSTLKGRRASWGSSDMARHCSSSSSAAPSPSACSRPVEARNTSVTLEGACSGNSAGSGSNSACSSSSKGRSSCGSSSSSGNACSSSGCACSSNCADSGGRMCYRSNTSSRKSEGASPRRRSSSGSGNGRVSSGCSSDKSNSTSRPGGPCSDSSFCRRCSCIKRDGRRCARCGHEDEGKLFLCWFLCHNAYEDFRVEELEALAAAEGIHKEYLWKGGALWPLHARRPRFTAAATDTAASGTTAAETAAAGTSVGGTSAGGTAASAPYFVYCRLPSEAAARRIQSRSILIRAFLEVWAEAPLYAELLQRMQQPECMQLFRKHVNAQQTWAFHVKALGKRFSVSEQQQRRSYFAPLFKGDEPVSLTAPAVTLVVVEEWPLTRKRDATASQTEEGAGAYPSGRRSSNSSSKRRSSSSYSSRRGSFSSAKKAAGDGGSRSATGAAAPDAVANGPRRIFFGRDVTAALADEESEAARPRSSSCSSRSTERRRSAAAEAAAAGGAGGSSRNQQQLLPRPQPAAKQQRQEKSQQQQWNAAEGEEGEAKQQEQRENEEQPQEKEKQPQEQQLQENETQPQEQQLQEKEKQQPRQQRKRTPWWWRYRLSARPVLGPTTLDVELAFLMCHQAQVRPGMVVLDPFVGTGSVLVAAAHHGAFCVGGDIDIRVLKGYSVSYLNPHLQHPPDAKTDIFRNFLAYGLSLPKVVRCDNAAWVWRLPPPESSAVGATAAPNERHSYAEEAAAAAARATAEATAEATAADVKGAAAAVPRATTAQPEGGAAGADAAAAAAAADLRTGASAAGLAPGAVGGRGTSAAVAAAAAACSEADVNARTAATGTKAETETKNIAAESSTESSHDEKKSCCCRPEDGRGVTRHCCGAAGANNSSKKSSLEQQGKEEKEEAAAAASPRTAAAAAAAAEEAVAAADAVEVSSCAAAGAPSSSADAAAAAGNSAAAAASSSSSTPEGGVLRRAGQRVHVHREGSCGQRRTKPWADAIITDPPYGIRTGARQSGHQQRHNGSSVERRDEDRATYISPTVNYERSAVITDLLNLAARLLTDGGRLVFLLPVEVNSASSDLALLQHADLSLTASSLQVLSAGLGRYLITMERKPRKSCSSR